MDDSPVYRTITGTCATMCPREEMVLRERENLLHPFEYQDGSSRRRPRADRQKMVKEYTRPAAGKHDPVPSELRPAPVLLHTLDYLITHIVPKRDCPWADVYDYVFDRIRAIRQDAVIQRIRGKPAITLLELAVRFHVYSSYRLCTEKQVVFDQKINDTHIQECLKRLLRFYDSEPGPHDNQEEFESVYVLYNLGSVEALRHMLQLPLILRNSPCVKLSWDISKAFLEGNYARLFRLVQRLSPIATCALHRHLTKIQRQAIRVMSHGYSNKNLKYPLSKLHKLLTFNSEEQARSACSTCGLQVCGDRISFLKTDFIEAQIEACYFDFIDRKLRRVSLPNLISRGIDQGEDRLCQGLDDLEIDDSKKQTDWWDGD